MGLTETLLHYITQLISYLGYAGVFILMALESMIAPVPSEMVMPFAGFLIHTGEFTVLGVLLASSLGSIVGSLASYWMGRKGEAVVLRFGRYLMLNPHHLEWTETFFFRYAHQLDLPVHSHRPPPDFHPGRTRQNAASAVCAVYRDRRHHLEHVPGLPGE